MRKHIAWALVLSLWGTQMIPTFANPVAEVAPITYTETNQGVSNQETPSTQNTEETATAEKTAKEIEAKEEIKEEPKEETEPTEDKEATTETDEPVEELFDPLGKIVLTLDSPKVLVHGEAALLDVAPTMIDGQTYVELRFIAEQLVQATTQWDPETKQTTLTKDGISITIAPDSNVAYVNEDPMPMPGAVKVQNGKTLVPLRFLSEQFGVKVDFQSGTIILTVEGGEPQEPAINHPPVAEFAFEQSTYTAGQQLTTLETSYDPDGNTLVDKQWMINNDPARVSHKLTNLMSKPKPGIYTIALKVKDSKGEWSEWVEDIVEILPNEKPQIEAITTSESEYAQGEMIELNYTYDNESWEEITAVKWSYRRSYEPENRKIAQIPDRLFSPGDYTVTLQLQDAYGNLSDIQEHTIKVTPEVLMTEMEYKFTQGKPGAVIDNYSGLNYREFPEETNVILTKNQDMLVMSDSPERVPKAGILYEETIQHSGRIMVHHVNAFTPEDNAASKKHIVVAVTNPGTEPVTLTIENKVVKGPNTDQLFIGQQLLKDYLKGTPAETYTIQPGQTLSIYESRNIRWGAEEVISGLMDFKTSAPVELQVAAINTEMTLADLPNLSYLPKDVHPRGTFYTTDLYHDVKLTSDKPSKIILGDRSTNVEPGIDSITGEVVLNTGNYGISYHVTITAQEDTAVVLNPRGGLFRGAIKWENDGVYLLPEVGFLPGAERAALIGVVKAGETKTFEYMLPNGSAAPVLIGFIPQNMWHTK